MSQVQALKVQLWNKNSKAAYYKGSHLRPLQARPAANGYLENPPTNLVIDAGPWTVFKITPEEIETV